MPAVTTFDNTRDLIFVPVRVWGPAGVARLRLAVDTGCAECTLVPRVARQLGYDVEGGQPTRIRSAIGIEYGRRITVDRFEALGFWLTELTVHVFDLAQVEDFDGLLGLRFLDELHYEIRQDEGIIIADAVP